MNMNAPNITVKMCRETLEGLPVHPLPPGCRIRAYAPGDEHAWVRIEAASERFHAISLDLFRREFGDDPALLAERQFFLLDERGAAIGTATAWFDPDHGGQPYGRIHWVAIHPDWQGRGLAKPLLSRVCGRLRELGHDRAYLVTSSARIVAINLYLSFGFQPEIHGAEEAAVWEQVRQQVQPGAGAAGAARPGLGS